MLSHQTSSPQGTGGLESKRPVRGQGKGTTLCAPLVLSPGFLCPHRDAGSDKMERYPEGPPCQALPCLASCSSRSSLVPVAKLWVSIADERGKEDA